MFSLEDEVEEKFGSFDETLAFVSEEKRRIVRLPLFGLWKSGARFQDDGSFGNKGTSFKFNNYGFQAICNLVGVSDQTLQRLTTPQLTASVLNDLISSSLEREQKTASAEIVCDEEKKNAIGIVSKKYVGYSNDGFLRDVLICLDEKNDGALFPSTGDFVFKEAYSINSRLFLRLNTRSVKGIVSGRGGSEDDVSEIEVEVSNSMAGGHAVNSLGLFSALSAPTVWLLKLREPKAGSSTLVETKVFAKGYMAPPRDCSKVWARPRR